MIWLTAQSASYPINSPSPFPTLLFLSLISTSFKCPYPILNFSFSATPKTPLPHPLPTLHIPYKKLSLHATQHTHMWAKIGLIWKSESERKCFPHTGYLLAFLSYSPPPPFFPLPSLSLSLSFLFSLSLSLTHSLFSFFISLSLYLSFSLSISLILSFPLYV